MTPDDVLSMIYRLRTNPFCPLVGIDGESIQDPFALPLNPSAEPRHVGYYYDLYDWSGSSQIGPLDPVQIVREFPAPEDLVNFGSLLTIIAGAEHSGRESLRNLLLHKISNQSGPPLMINLVLEGGERSQIVKQVAELFMLEYPSHFATPTFDRLQQAFQTMTKTKVTGQYSYFANLFQFWRNQIKTVCNRALVLSIVGTADYNSWRVLYNSTQALFSYIFVLTGDIASAKTCRNTMQGGNVAVIVAPPLNETEALQYVRFRVNRERVTNIHQPLEPFSPAAISALYQRGPTATENVHWRIGFLNRTMRRALDDHLARLVHLLQERGSLDRGLLLPNEIEIDGEAVRRAREALNMGK